MLSTSFSTMFLNSKKKKKKKKKMICDGILSGALCHFCSIALFPNIYNNVNFMAKNESYLSNFYSKLDFWIFFYYSILNFAFLH